MEIEKINKERMLDALMEHIPDSVYFKDLSSRFMMVSKAKADNSNTTPEKMVGMTDFDFLPEEEAKEAFMDEQRITETSWPILDKVEKLTRPDGNEAWVSVSKTPWRNKKGEIIGIIGISRDITKRIEMEKHIFDMLSIATHDIRSPLASIGATMKLLLRGSFGEMDESVRNTLEDLRQRVYKLERIVNDYLNKSSLIFTDIRIPNKENIDLREDIIDPVLNDLSHEIEKNQSLIDNRLGAIPGDKILISANKNWLRIVYRNLIGNAIKYGGKGCTIAFGFEESGDYYKLNVYNNGPAVLDCEKIFDKFESTEGMGLGLPIARKLIRNHGGEMWCENTMDGHPNFVFTIPK